MRSPLEPVSLLVAGLLALACASSEEVGASGGSGGSGGSATGGSGGGAAGSFGGGGWPTGGATGANRVTVAAGPFTMGCKSGCVESDYPEHNVTLSAFEIDETEVTQARFQECLAAGLCTEPACDFDPTSKGDWPVVCVGWAQAKAFCSWAGLRLPTEAQWEKAARGTDARRFPWGDDAPTCDLTNFNDCSSGAEPVGSHPAGASPYGALDMAGNVWEWVEDYHSVDYYTSGPTTDPPGPSSGTNRVFRGGGHDSPTEDIASWEREDQVPTWNATVAGFRCAKELQ